jgi:hypothetical protein
MPVRAPLLALPILLATIASNASASVISSHHGPWRADEEGACLAENKSNSPEVAAERAETIGKDPSARIDVAMGVQAGFGSPGGVGGYLGHANDGTPASLGWSGFVRADVMAMRPLWLSAQTHLLTTPNVEGASVMSDVLVGWDFHGYGNSWSALRRRHPDEINYECIFGRYDVALVGGLKEVVTLGDARMDNWHALLGGVQLRFLRALLGGPFGLDFDILGVYDPTTRGAGAQLQDVLHIGVFDFSQNIGFTWHRGAWATIGVGAGFDL